MNLKLVYVYVYVYVSRVGARSNTSTVALRVVGGDEKVTQCLGLEPDHPLPG
jgi:hypothetical protein